jgi:hypothetical protein
LLSNNTGHYYVHARWHLDREAGKAKTASLIYWPGRWWRGPVCLRKFDAPEVWAGGQEFHTYAGPFIGGIAQIHDAAFLFFLGNGIDEDKFRTQFERFLQVKQATVGVDHNRMAALPEFPPVGAFSTRAHGDPRKHPRTSALGACLRFCSGGHKAIVQCAMK